MEANCPLNVWRAKGSFDHASSGHFAQDDNRKKEQIPRFARDNKQEVGWACDPQTLN
jgi:hypothetical protein